MSLKPFIALAGLLAAAIVVVPGSTAQAATTRYEAETAPATCNGTIDSNHAGFSGTGFCNGTNATGAAVQFTVNVPAAGQATLGVRFANGTTSTRSVSLIVNGATVQSTSFEGTGAWTTWVTKNLTASLNAGSNTVRLNPTSSGGLPNIDYLEVTDGPPPAQAGLYVAPGGNDANPGTLAQPLRTLQRAVDLAQPGTTIFLRGGTYAPSTNVRIMKDGTAANPYTIMPHNGEKVILDGESLPHTPAPVDGSIPNLERGVLHIEADFWRVVNIEIIHGPYAIFCRDCNNNIFDRLITRDNYESGLHIQAASSNNQVINLDSFGNRDPRNNGESADGLAIKEGSGSGNVVRGARLWNNSDDGFDAWEFLSPIQIENSLAWGNGFNRWNLPDYTGDGNGFKLGGGDEDLPAAHVTRNSMAWDNAVGGFIDNANPGGLVTDRCTAWRNGGTGFDFADADGTLTRNLAVSNNPNSSLGSGSSGSGNSWDIGGSWPLASTDPSTITGPRQSNGAIPPSTFLRPSNGADVGARF
jgi:pectate lyase-like protein/carbohydrate binding protein with CBM35 domain/uncharacterized protein DUF1565